MQEVISIQSSAVIFWCDRPLIFWMMWTTKIMCFPPQIKFQSKLQSLQMLFHPFLAQNFTHSHKNMDNVGKGEKNIYIFKESLRKQKCSVNNGTNNIAHVFSSRHNWIICTHKWEMNANLPILFFSMVNEA